jgi:hypothetical protein
MTETLTRCATCGNSSKPEFLIQGFWSCRNCSEDYATATEMKDRLEAQTREVMAERVRNAYWELVAIEDSLRGDDVIISVTRVDINNAMVHLGKAYRNLKREAS